MPTTTFFSIRRSTINNSVTKKGDNEFYTNKIEGHEGKDVTIIITHKSDKPNGGGSVKKKQSNAAASQNVSPGRNVWFSGGNSR